MTASNLVAARPDSDALEIERLADAIDVTSPASVASFGQAIGRQTAAYADDLLSKARAGDLDEIGGKLNAIIASAQSFDLSSLDNKWARTPVVGLVVRQFARTKGKAMARFASVQTQVDKLVDSVEGTAERLARRTADFDDMFAGVRNEHDLLDQHVRAGRRRLERLDEEIAARSADPSDPMEREDLAGMRTSRAALEKRVADLAVLQHSALQTLPMIRMMQANNLALIEKFQTIQRLTLPTWKRTFLMTLTLTEQREASELANNIDDATNYFMRRNAELLHENTVATAKANQRLVVDIETLRVVHDEVVQALLDVRSVHEEGAKNRSAAMAELEDLRSRMSQGVLTSGTAKHDRQIFATR